jgi:hypothetical protein
MIEFLACLLACTVSSSLRAVPLLAVDFGSRLGCVAMLCIVGCDADGLQTIPVSGQVTFNGGPCPAEGTIAFSPVATEGGAPRRPATARFGRDGQFSVTSFEEGDGLLPGRYVPIITCWLGQPSNDDPTSYERLNAVPSDYKPGEIVVDRTNKSLTVQFNVPKKK